MGNKKRVGLLTLLTGVTLGAATVYFTDKKNRDKTKKTAKSLASKVKKIKDDYQQDPEQTKEKVVSSLKKKVTESKNKICEFFDDEAEDQAKTKKKESLKK